MIYVISTSIFTECLTQYKMFFKTLAHLNFSITLVEVKADVNTLIMFMKRIKFRKLIIIRANTLE